MNQNKEVLIGNDNMDDILRDAMRFRAMVNSPCIRILGQSGLGKHRKGHEETTGYAHFGMEIWSLKGEGFEKHYDLEYGRQIFTEYADVLVENTARQKTMKIEVTLPEQGDETTLLVKGVSTPVQMEIGKEKTKELLSSEDPVNAIKNYIKFLGISVDVTVG